VLIDGKFSTYPDIKGAKVEKQHADAAFLRPQVHKEWITMSKIGKTHR
jgi:hypothetical protein